MKHVPFNYERRSWDRYKAFHCVDGQFTQFETGEVILTNGYPRPDKRGDFPNRGVAIYGTNDYRCPKLFTDKDLKDPVPTAWLKDEGQQYLAVDYQQGVAVRLQSPYSDTNPQTVPEHLKGASAIWMRPNQKPLSLTPIVVSMPDKDFRDAMRKKLRDVRVAVSAAARLQGITEAYYTSKCNVARRWYDTPVEDIVAEILRDNTTTRWVTYGGWEYPRLAVECAYLYTEKRT